MNFQEKVRIEDELLHYLGIEERASALFNGCNLSTEGVVGIYVYCEGQIKSCLEKLNAE